LTDRYIDPSRKHFDAFKALPRAEPVHMLNLLQYRDFADYPEGHELAGQGLSGEAAYKLYGENSGPIFRRVGGEVLWRGRYETMVIGPDDKAWDLIFVARYPTAGAFLEMVTDPDYQRAVVHRTAALVTSRLMRCGELPIQNGTFA